MTRETAQECSFAEGEVFEPRLPLTAGGGGGVGDQTAGDDGDHADDAGFLGFGAHPSQRRGRS
ncbi:hypothetical protein VSH64_18415 [Amycolatopsis rhabdoformis]|uniref:Uncharacterized protein n=1 Tax=Amycolatopsis rhabdoformis TaxID=1448059 RepID=A0ABZ1II34_9PSEU|nr:hypothetical protein [Amycolatopsis rhabdoformis]WSE34047.1 hypothetical protein VSH64_18415 [Amycolatopsis rhabdoformis]